MANNKIQSLTVNGITYDIVDNISGYIKSFIETDPTVPAWAKAANKPTYTASEVGALPSSTVIPTVPTNVSSFINDAGYLTSSDIASVLKYKGTKASYSALPSSGNVTGDVWHLTDTGAEWAWDGSAWQELGTAIDLSGYVESSRTADSTTTIFSNTGVGGSIQSTYQGTNNEAYIQTAADNSSGSIELYASDGIHYNQIYINPIETYIGNILTPINNTDAANKKYVDDSVGALSIPTKTSDLTNDSGFLTSFAETDPTVPSWAKQSTKPSYGLTEISGTDDLRAIEGLTGTSGLLKKTAANTWTLDTNTYLTSYTETDPVFTASAAAGITSTDISNWNAKVSDTGKWNNVTLSTSTTSSASNYYIPSLSSTSGTTAYLYTVTNNPTNNAIAKYDASAYLNSTTPSANDNSTKVATTAYVDAAIPDTSGFVSKSGDTMSGDLTFAYNNGIIMTMAESTLLNTPQRLISFITVGQAGSGNTAYTNFRFKVSPSTQNQAIQIYGIHTPEDTGTNYDTYIASKKYVDDSIPKVYSSTNTGGYLTMATLPMYDGTVV